MILEKTELLVTFESIVGTEDDEKEGEGEGEDEDEDEDEEGILDRDVKGGESGIKAGECSRDRARS